MRERERLMLSLFCFVDIIVMYMPMDRASPFGELFQIIKVLVLERGSH